MSRLSAFVKSVVERTLVRADALRIKALHAAGPSSASARLSAIGLDTPGSIASVRAYRAQSATRLGVENSQSLSNREAAALIRSLADVGDLDAATQIFDSRSSEGHGDLSWMLVEDVAPAETLPPSWDTRRGEHRSLSPQAAVVLCRLLLSKHAIDQATGFVLGAYAQGCHATAALRVLLQHHWRLADYEAARSLAEALRAHEPIIAEYYSLYHAVHLSPERDLTDRAEELVRTIDNLAEPSPIAGIEHLAFEFLLRWRAVDDASAFFERYRDRLLIDTVRAATLAASLVKRINDAGEPNRALSLADELGDLNQLDTFRPCFLLRAAEASIAARKATEAETPPRSGALEAFAIHQRHAGHPYNRALGEHWRAFYDRANQRGECLFDVRVDQRQRDALIDRVRTALRTGEPLSAIRIGDGESYGYDMEGLRAAPEDLAAPLLADEGGRLARDHDELERVWWGRPIAPDLKAALKRGFQDAVRNADIIGVPNAFRLCRDARPAAPLYETRHGRGLAHALIETIHALDEREGPAPCITDERFNHLFTRDVVAELCELAERVIVVGPYGEEIMRKALGGGDKLEVIQIPPQVNVRGAVRAEQKLHQSLASPQASLPATADNIFDGIVSTAKANSIALTGAGIITKFLVCGARHTGAVALDIGATVDAWVKIKSRTTLDYANRYNL